MLGFILVFLAIAYLLVAQDTAEKIDAMTQIEGSGYVFVVVFTLFTLLAFVAKQGA